VLKQSGEWLNWRQKRKRSQMQIAKRKRYGSTHAKAAIKSWAKRQNNKRSRSKPTRRLLNSRWQPATMRIILQGRQRTALT
jgi:hypothetical protein